MRQISAETIREAVKRLFLEASYHIGTDVCECLKNSKATEKSPLGRSVLDQIIKNDEIAATESLAICQDTGFAVIFVKWGQNVQLVGGSFNDVFAAGVRDAYSEGFLRKSVVCDPVFDRKNTQDNTPPVIHLEIVDGDQVDILVSPKGFGSENMSGIKMLVPADGVEGVRNFIVETVQKAGPNPCPPMIVGVGIGGTMEKAAILAKWATTRAVGSKNPNERYAQLEEEVLQRVNRLGIGPAGTGGSTTALAVNIEYFPTHIAGLPVAVNICCHAARHAHTVL